MREASVKSPTTLLHETASQTAGPYVDIGCAPNAAGISGVLPQDLGKTVVTAAAIGEHITLTGKVFDGTRTPIRDAIVELWQADHAGLFNCPQETRGTADSGVLGFGRSSTSQDGNYRFETVKPGRVPWPDSRLQAPHISLVVFARGINIGLHTRVYFGDEATANAEDPLLNRIEQPSRVETLISTVKGKIHTFNIHLQGDHETVFLDI